MFISSQRPVYSFKNNSTMEDTLEQLLKGCSLDNDSSDDEEHKPKVIVKNTANVKYYKSQANPLTSDKKPEGESVKDNKSFIKNGILFKYRHKTESTSNSAKSEDNYESSTKNDNKSKEQTDKAKRDAIENELEMLISNICLDDDIKREKPKPKLEKIEKNPPKNIFVLVKRGPDRTKHFNILPNTTPYEKHINRKSLSGGVVVLKPDTSYAGSIESQLIPTTLNNHDSCHLPNLNGINQEREDYDESDVLNKIFEKYPDILQSLESDQYENQESEMIFQVPSEELPTFVGSMPMLSNNSTPSPQLSTSSPFYDSDSPQYIQYSPNVGYNPPSVEVVNSNNAENFMYEHGANLTRQSFFESSPRQDDQTKITTTSLSPNIFTSTLLENSFNIVTNIPQNPQINQYNIQYPSIDLTDDNEVSQKSVNNSTASVANTITYSSTRLGNLTSPTSSKTFTKIASKRVYSCCKVESKSSDEILALKLSELSIEMQAAILKRITKESDLTSCLDGLLSTWNDDQTNKLPQIQTLYLICKQLLLDEKQKTKFVELYTNGLTLLDRAIKVCYKSPIVVKFLAECVCKVMNESEEATSSFEVDQTDLSGNGMFHRAVMRGTDCGDAIAAIFTLKSKENMKFHVNKLNSDGYSPLHLACSIHNSTSGNDGCSCVYLTHVLIKHGGADVNLKDGRGGETPLHIAINSSKCAVELVNLLLKHGANPSTANYSGTTPLNLAESISRSQPKTHYTKELLFNLKNWSVGAQKKVPG